MTLQRADLEPYLAQPSPEEHHVQRLLWGRRAPVIFDVGACEGEETIRYSRLFPKASIFSFEPLPENGKLMDENLKRYGVRNAQVFPLALSEQAGQATFHVSSGQPPDHFLGEDWNYGNKSSSLLEPLITDPALAWLEYNQTIAVECETLDRFCATHEVRAIDFLHMDVQGAESAVLRGAERMLPHIGAIWLETADKELYRGQSVRGEMEAFMRRQHFALVLTKMRGVEGDQLYVNLRSVRGAIYAAAARGLGFVSRSRT